MKYKFVRVMDRTHNYPILIHGRHIYKITCLVFLRGISIFSIGCLFLNFHNVRCQMAVYSALYRHSLLFSYSPTEIQPTLYLINHQICHNFITGGLFLTFDGSNYLENDEEKHLYRNKWCGAILQ